MIKDSGNRTQFASGAVRDVQEGKGRCDLLPLDIVLEAATEARHLNCKDPLAYIHRFIVDGGDYKELLRAACAIFQFNCTFEEDCWLYPEGDAPFGDFYTMVIEYSIHLEEGCKKYGPRNWQKGIPLCNYVSSAVRHYLKFCRGDDDERHDRAFVWNCLCGAWTAKHMPELNEYHVELGGE